MVAKFDVDTLVRQLRDAAAGANAAADVVMRDIALWTLKTL